MSFVLGITHCDVSFFNCVVPCIAVAMRALDGYLQYTGHDRWDPKLCIVSGDTIVTIGLKMTKFNSKHVA